MERILRPVRLVAPVVVSFAALHAAVLAGCLHGAHEQQAFSVVEIRPQPGAIGRDQRFEVVLNRPVQADSLSSCPFMLILEEDMADALPEIESGGSADVPGELAECPGQGMTVSGGLISFAPARSLRPGGVYRLVGAPWVRDYKGFKLAGTGGGAWVSEGAFAVEGAIGSARAALVISEIMANPVGDEEIAEFVELYNGGSVDADMEFWSLDFGAGVEQTLRACGRQTVIRPGGFGVIGSEKISLKDLPEETPLACVGGRLGGRGLSNSAGQRIILLNPEGIAASGYGGWLSQSEDGYSIERIDLSGGDEEKNWAPGIEQGGTPGRQRDVPGLPAEPVLLRFAPRGEGVPVGAVFSLLFDRDVACPRTDGCARICPSAECCLNGKDSIAGKSISGGPGSSWMFTPVQPLPPETTVWLSVLGFKGSDGAVMNAACEPLKTGVAGDSVAPRAKLGFPPDGAVGVPSSTSFIQLDFSELIRVPDRGAIGIVSAGRALPLDCSPLPGGSSLECAAADGVGFGGDVRIEIFGAVSDLAGNLAARGTIGRFGTVCSNDAEPPILGVRMISMTPGGAALEWTSTEPCRLSWALMPPGRDYSQQRNTGGSVSSGETLVVLYDAASSIRDFVAVCRDSSGNFSAESRIALDPADLQPAVAINEVMANPEGLDSAGEYIELANYGGDIISLAGWRIGRCEEPEKSLVLGDEGLSPGQFILITSDKAEAERFPWEARLVRLKGGPIPGGISNSKSEKICLYEPEGMEVSSYRGWLIPEEGRSIERIDSAFPDYAGIWRQSAEKGGSPGKMNGSPK